MGDRMKFKVNEIVDIEIDSNVDEINGCLVEYQNISITCMDKEVDYLELDEKAINPELVYERIISDYPF